MSDWIKEHKFTVVFIVILFIVGFFSVIKPYVDLNDKAVYERMDVELNRKMDTLVSINLEILKTIQNDTIK